LLVFLLVNSTVETWLTRTVVNAFFFAIDFLRTNLLRPEHST
jgi:hypothetical protein